LTFPLVYVGNCYFLLKVYVIGSQLFQPRTFRTRVFWRSSAEGFKTIYRTSNFIYFINMVFLVLGKMLSGLLLPSLYFMTSFRIPLVS